MSEEPQPVLDDATAIRLATALRNAQKQLDNWQALPPGSHERAEKWDELREIGDEINSFFRPISN
jgi:hypothetical protein